MKPFRKNDEGEFICEECEKICKNESGFGQHILIHGSKENYYEKWAKEKTDGICLECGKPTHIKALYYQKFCSNKCSTKYNNLRYFNSKETKQKTKNNLKEKYNVENVFQLESVKNKCKEQHIKNLGVEHPSQSNKIKEKKVKTCLKNHSVEYPMQSEKIKEKSVNTLIIKYGVTNSYLIPYIREKSLSFPRDENFYKKVKATKKEKYGDENFNNREKAKNTCLELYGVENNMQHPELFEKNQKAALCLLYYKDLDIYYQGTFELDFLKKYRDKFSDIKRGPSIKYIFNGKNKVYHPDLYIPSLNLIVEIKNSWLAERDKEQIEAKRKATIANDFNYIMIIDKKYSEFNLKYIN